MKKFIKVLFVMLFALVSLPINPIVYGQEKKKVMTTFYPVYYLAQTIAGDKLEVSMLLDGGQGAHGYESTAKDAANVQNADLFIYLDDEMEYFVADLMNVIDQSKTKVLETTKDINLLDGSGHTVHDHGDHGHEEEAHEEDHGHEEEVHEEEAHEEDHGHEEEVHEEEAHEDEHGHEGHAHEYDPHTWLDPLVYAQQAENVKEALMELDPENATFYEENAQTLVTKLEELDKEYHEALESLEHRTILVQHAAFGYLANAYELEQVAITGLNTTKEPSAQVIAEMQEYMKENQTKVIYVDPALKEDIAKTVATATKAELLPLRTLEVVTFDEMAEGVDYFTIMRDNLNELLKNK